MCEFSINWDITQVDDLYIYSIVYGNEKYVAIGAHGGAYSVDGFNWTYLSSKNVTGYCIKYENEMYIVANRVTLSTSKDGINWDSRTITNEIGERKVVNSIYIVK